MLISSHSAKDPLQSHFQGWILLNKFTFWIIVWKCRWFERNIFVNDLMNIIVNFKISSTYDAIFSWDYVVLGLKPAKSLAFSRILSFWRISACCRARYSIDDFRVSKFSTHSWFRSKGNEKSPSMSWASFILCSASIFGSAYITVVFKNEKIK